MKPVLELIQTHSLTPATQRELSLVTLSAIGEGYSVHMQKIAGFTYRALAAYGKDKYFHTLMNEEEIREKTAQLISDGKAEDVLRRAWQAFQRVSKIPKPIIQHVLEDYATYMACIGTYNCFWRYADTEGKLSPDMIARLAKERQEVASYYTKVERTLLAELERIEQKNKITKGMLRNMTLNELEGFMKGKRMDVSIRMYGYVYVREGAEESVFTDGGTLRAVQALLETPIGKEVHGHVAYGGTARGHVLNILERKDAPDGFVLVAPSTHPDMAPLIKRAVAIIADEGGVLSHAAIISRELKKPCIIGTKNASKTFKSGTIVHVDADKGVARIDETVKGI